LRREDIRVPLVLKAIAEYNTIFYDTKQKGNLYYSFSIYECVLTDDAYYYLRKTYTKTKSKSPAPVTKCNYSVLC